MSIAAFLSAYDPQAHLAAFVLGSTRLTVFVSVAPCFGAARLEMTARSALVIALYIVLHPAVVASLPAELFPISGASWVHLAGLMFKEVFIGFVLGWLSGLVFWAVEGAGFFIDNQRGAGMAAEHDPITGSETSPTGEFLLMSTVYVFFASGAFCAMLALLYGTYEIWPVGAWLPAALFEKAGAALFFGEKLAELALQIVLISAPVVLACLFADAALGLVNRFAPQLNVYVIAMPVKCAVASFLLIFYFAILLTDASERFSAFGLDLSVLRTMLQ